MKKLQVSVSGGRTSLYMAAQLLEHCVDEYEFMFIFANTGLEHEDTLRFLHEGSQALNIPVVWVEAVTHHGERKGCTHKVVTYETASRNGEPFEAMIDKYGIPNLKGKYCTRELKLNAIKSYTRSQGWKRRDYETAIGIREDESRRVSVNADVENIIYPLVDMFPVDKIDVLHYMKQFDWDLRIPEHQGNCQMCFAKSYKKLNMVYRQTPQVFEFTDRMEKKYPRHGGWMQNHPDAPDATFFRGNLSTQALFKMFDDVGEPENMPPEINAGGCSESCEMYETEYFDFYLNR
jgi:hypothetical protein